MRAYLFDMINVEQLCDEFEKVITNNFFTSGESERATNKQYYYTPIFHQKFDPIKRVIDGLGFFNIEPIEINRDFLNEKVNMLEGGNRAFYIDFFKADVSSIKNVFSEAIEEIKHLCLLLDEIEMNRINEAIHDFLEGCYYSSVAMSVCAIESRLLKLMLSVNPNEERKLEKKTLGQLIEECIKDQYNDLIPVKHKPLLDLCNVYRIFSVHPKEEEIPKGLASSILNLSILFLTDDGTQVAKEITEV